MCVRDVGRLMCERYGDFSFYRPSLTAQTLLLCFGPLFFLLICVFVARSIFKRAKEVGDIESKLSESQKTRLNELIGEKQG